MLIHLINCLLLVSLSHQYQNNGGDLDAVMKHLYPNEYARNFTPSRRVECYTDAGEPGECLPYYLCDGGVASTDGSGVIDIRMAGDGTSCSFLNECCLPPNIRETNNPLVVSGRIRPQLQQRTGCGWRNSNGLGFRITGNKDNEAEFGEFPWMVAVLRREPINEYQSIFMYAGGGSLIHPSVVLTAAHIINSTSLRVRAGEWDTGTEGELFQYQDRDVAEVEIHDKFNRANLYYDAALLFLKKPMDLAPNVGLACIPRPEEFLNPNMDCFATGWGKDKFGRDGQYQNILKKVDLRIVPHDTCEALLRRTRLNKYFNLHSSFICAGGEPNKDTCTGDGGSPLVCPIQFDRERYRQVGIVSWGIDCGLAGVPAAYGDVAKFGDWIDRRVAQRGYDTSVYRYN